VIGYIAGTNTLTLKGSKEYTNNNTIKQYAIDNFGGLENQTVYLAYFQFGSLVATSSDPADTASPYFASSDIIAAPSEWKGSLQGAKDFIGTTWANIPIYTASDYNSGKTNVSSSAYQSPSTGKGDPCAYYTNYFGTGWRLPTGNPYNGTPDYDSYNLGWHDAGLLGTGIPGGGLSTRTGETGMFYPAAGARMTGGAVSYQGSNGGYWSSTASDGGNGWAIGVGNGYANPTSLVSYDTSFAVRCVK
jgi:hypothetical protein